MYAIVCDKCGKTALIEDFNCYTHQRKVTGFHHVCVDDPASSSLDLCEECAKELLGLVRGEEADNA